MVQSPSRNPKREARTASAILPGVTISRNLGPASTGSESASMSRAATNLDPWRLVWGQPYIDSRTLAAAIEQDLATRQQPRLPHPAAGPRCGGGDAIRTGDPGDSRNGWRPAPSGPRIRAILDEDLGEPGFPAIRRRLVDSIDSTRLSRIFDLLGRGIHGRVEIHIAGSIPTLIKGLTARPTGDIDFVDEVPAEIRRQRDVLRKIETEFGLKLGHVQSHYLPAHWRDRRQWLGDFGGLRVYVVDEYDIFVSKLSSKKEKHQSDLGVLALELDKETARQRLLNDGQSLPRRSQAASADPGELAVHLPAAAGPGRAAFRKTDQLREGSE